MNTDALSNIVITKVNSALTLYTPANVGKVRINRPRWAIVIKFEGETIYTHDKQQYLSDKNHVVILPKGITYEWHCTKAGRFFIIDFECATAINKLYSFYLANSEKIIKLFHEIEYNTNAKTPFYEIENIKDTYSILLALIKNSFREYTTKEKKAKLSTVIEFIQQNYNKKLSNDDLANLAGFSTVYFRKLFTATVGVSPMVYARSVRINKAKELLKSEYGSLSSVALSLGYSDLYDFSRDFKKHVGVSPSNYK